VYQVVSSGFTGLAALCAFWVIARLIAVGWHDYLAPFVEKSTQPPESHLFPIIYRVATVFFWVYAIFTSASVAGIDSAKLLHDVLAAEILNNSVYQYLGFFTLIALALVVARLVLIQSKKAIARFLRNKGVDEEHLEQNWFSDVNQPLLLLIIFLGARLATEVFTEVVDEATFSVHGAISMAIDVGIVLILTWIFYTLVEKAFAFIITPLNNKTEFLEPQFLGIIQTFAKTLVVVAGIVFFILALGRDPVSVLAGMGLSGLVLGFAAKDTLSPLVSGIAVYITKPFTLGDHVVLSEEIEGTVIEVRVRSTVLRTNMGTTVIVPNDKVINSVIHNKMVDGRAYDGLFMRIDIATPPEKRDETIELFSQAIRDTEHADDPTVYFLEYGSDNLGLLMSYWVDNPTLMWHVRTNIMLKIDSRLRDIGVEMSLPTAALNFHGYLPGGDAPTVQIVPLPGQKVSP